MSNFTAQQLIDAIRSDRMIGRGTCTSIDECYDDDDLVCLFGDHPTLDAAVDAARWHEGIWAERAEDIRNA